MAEAFESPLAKALGFDTAEEMKLWMKDRVALYGTALEQMSHGAQCPSDGVILLAASLSYALEAIARLVRNCAAVAFQDRSMPEHVVIVRKDLPTFYVVIDQLQEKAYEKDYRPPSVFDRAKLLSAVVYTTARGFRDPLKDLVHWKWPAHIDSVDWRSARNNATHFEAVRRREPDDKNWTMLAIGKGDSDNAICDRLLSIYSYL